MPREGDDAGGGGVGGVWIGRLAPGRGRIVMIDPVLRSIMSGGRRSVRKEVRWFRSPPPVIRGLRHGRDGPPRPRRTRRGCRPVRLVADRSASCLSSSSRVQSARTAMRFAPRLQCPRRRCERRLVASDDRRWRPLSARPGPSRRRAREPPVTTATLPARSGSRTTLAGPACHAHGSPPLVSRTAAVTLLPRNGGGPAIRLRCMPTKRQSSSPCTAIVRRNSPLAGCPDIGLLNRRQWLSQRRREGRYWDHRSSTRE